MSARGRVRQGSRKSQALPGGITPLRSRAKSPRSAEYIRRKNYAYDFLEKRVKIVQLKELGEEPRKRQSSAVRTPRVPHLTTYFPHSTIQDDLLRYRAQVVIRRKPSLAKSYVSNLPVAPDNATPKEIVYQAQDRAEFNRLRAAKYKFHFRRKETEQVDGKGVAARHTHFPRRSIFQQRLPGYLSKTVFLPRGAHRIPRSKFAANIGNAEKHLFQKTHAGSRLNLFDDRLS